jgi:NTE family protein
MERPTRVSLALGGGGARGYAHIGVIQVLQERGFDIVGVAGSSMGALVAGMHAAGALPEYTDWALGLTRFQVMRLLGLPKPGGAFTADRVLDRMGEMLAGALIEDLPIPFTAVATDLLARKPVWFQKGPVDMAIRASIAIPGFFAPVVLDGRVLVDGGIIDPVPMTPLASVPADLTMAVSLSGDRTSPEPSPSEVTKDAPTTSGLTTLSVVNLSYDAMQDVISRYRLAGYPPDILVTVPKDSCGTLDFHRAEELIEVGRQCAGGALDGWAAMARTTSPS